MGRVARLMAGSESDSRPLGCCCCPWSFQVGFVRSREAAGLANYNTPRGPRGQVGSASKDGWVVSRYGVLIGKYASQKKAGLARVASKSR